MKGRLIPGKTTNEPQAIVVRFRDNAWEFYVGWNAALGAARWSSSPNDAERFPSWEAAERVASKYQAGFARRIAVGR
jgi:hypothetical protein